MKERGFTIIEVIVTITVVSALVYLLSNLLSSTLKGGSKTQLLGIVRQNGQQALDSVADTLRSSDEVVCVDFSTGTYGSDGGGPRIVVFSQGQYIGLRMVPETGGANGYLYRYTPVIAPNTEPTNPAELLAVCTRAETGQVVLTDQNPVSGVSLRSGRFFVTKSAGVKTTVQIQFDLAPGVEAGSSYENQLGGSGVLSFQTTVQLR